MLELSILFSTSGKYFSTGYKFSLMLINVDLNFVIFWPNDIFFFSIVCFFFHWKKSWWPSKHFIFRGKWWIINVSRRYVAFSRKTCCKSLSALINLKGGSCSEFLACGWLQILESVQWLTKTFICCYRLGKQGRLSFLPKSIYDHTAAVHYRDAKT